MDNMRNVQPLTGCNNGGSNNPGYRKKKGGSIIIIPCHFLIRGREGNIEFLKNKKRLKKSWDLASMFEKNLINEEVLQGGRYNVVTTLGGRTIIDEAFRFSKRRNNVTFYFIIFLSFKVATVEDTNLG
ncbi:MAG: hypothetical protein ACTHK0_07405 [Ginsengibacter sp.]